MVRKLSKQCQDVIDLARREGSITPQNVSSTFGVNPGAARKLLYSMLSDDDQLVSPERGVYELPEEKTVTSEGDITESAGPTEDVTEPEDPAKEYRFWGIARRESGTTACSTAMLSRTRSCGGGEVTWINRRADHVGPSLARRHKKKRRVKLTLGGS